LRHYLLELELDYLCVSRDNFSVPIIDLIGRQSSLLVVP
jgi:hypothetical protein